MTMTITPATSPLRRSASDRHARPLQRQSSAVYRRRRAVVGSITAIFAAVSIMTAHDVLVGSGGVPASATSGQLARSSVVAQPGDTLWSIAMNHRGDVSITRYVDKLYELNDGAAIEAGQRVVLP